MKLKRMASREGMMKLDNRVAALEAKEPNKKIRHSHLIGCVAGQTEAEAIEAYGKDRVSADDMVIMLVVMP